MKHIKPHPIKLNEFYIFPTERNINPLLHDISDIRDYIVSSCEEGSCDEVLAKLNNVEKFFKDMKPNVKQHDDANWDDDNSDGAAS